MDNYDFNQNVYGSEHYKDWNNKLGKNFTHNNGLHNELMYNKNIETGGGYQATVSGMYGEFTIAAIFKSLPEEYAVLNDILIQTGTKFRKYTYKDIVKYGETPWELAVKLDKKHYKKVNKQSALRDLQINQRAAYYEIVKKSSQIDHIIVSPYGIFVVETKNHKGCIFGGVNERVWTQVLNGENGIRSYGGHAHYTFLNPVIQNELHLQHLSKNLKLGYQFMTSMIVFTNPEAYLGNVNCDCCYTLDMFAEAIFSYNKQIWTEKQRDKVIKEIEKMNSNNYSLSKEHIKYVKDMQHRHEINKMYMY